MCYYNFAGNLIANLEEYPFKTIRHVECQFVQTSSKRCPKCQSYRKTLTALHHKHSQLSKLEPTTSSTSPSVYTNHRFLNNEQLAAEIKHLRHQLNLAKSKIQYLQNKIMNDNQVNSIQLDATMNSNFISIMKEHHHQIISMYPGDSFQHIFWKTQFEAMGKSTNRIRWHPTFLKWCIFLRYKSPSAYELIRKSKCIQLPSQRTLRAYTHYDSKAGFSTELDEQLLHEYSQCTEQYQKHVVLLGDEMHIREGLVFKQNTGGLIGYCEMDDINDHLLTLEKKYQNDKVPANKLATTVLALMVRGLFTDLNFPYASFPS